MYSGKIWQSCRLKYKIGNCSLTNQSIYIQRHSIRNTAPARLCTSRGRGGWHGCLSCGKARQCVVFRQICGCFAIISGFLPMIPLLLRSCSALFGQGKFYRKNQKCEKNIDTFRNLVVDYKRGSTAKNHVNFSGGIHYQIL